jgi:hypothetical protein
MISNWYPFSLLGFNDWCDHSFCYRISFACRFLAFMIPWFLLADIKEALCSVLLIVYGGFDCIPSAPTSNETIGNGTNMSEWTNGNGTNRTCVNSNTRKLLSIINCCYDLLTFAISCYAVVLDRHRWLSHLYTH